MLVISSSIKIMSNQMKSRKVSDSDEDREIDSSKAISMSSAVHVVKKAKREANIFLRILEGVLLIKNELDDHAVFDQILDGDLSDLDELIGHNITAIDNFWGSIGYSLLVNAAESGQINIVKLLLKHAPDKTTIKAIDKNCNTLLYACMAGHTAVV